MKQLLILLVLISTPLFSADFPSRPELEANTKKALERLIPIYKAKAIKTFEEIIYDGSIAKSNELIVLLASHLNDRESQSYTVDKVEVKDNLTSTYISWFHTDSDQKANDIYFKISSVSRIYEYYCTILYTRTSFHVAGCEIYLNDSRLGLEGLPAQDIYMQPILPLYNGMILSVYIDEQLDPSLSASSLRGLRAIDGSAGKFCVQSESF